MNLDPVHGRGRWRRRAQDIPWPCPDSSSEGIVASHVMEHIPAGGERIAVLNECHRVLAAGAMLLVIVPLFPSWQAMADPTHVSYWVPESFAYLTGELTAEADYGLAVWDLKDFQVRDGWEGYAVLVPQK